VQEVLTRYKLESGNYYYVTCHRAETVDDPNRLNTVVDILSELERPAVFSVHPRFRRNLTRLGRWRELKTMRHLRPTAPLPHIESLALVAGAHSVLTDSGGVQREAYWSGTSCLLLRDRTEWTELVSCGAVRLTDLDGTKIARSLRRRAKIQPVGDRFFTIRQPSRRIINRLARDLASN
jgi:UDP-N-acetylglucosamine 2-epimerase